MRKVIMILLALVLTCASCVHKDLCYTHPHTQDVKVEFVWDKVADANPEWMNVILFSEDGYGSHMYQLAGRDGGYIKLQPGRYKAIAYNGDTETIHYYGTESFEDFYLTTRYTKVLASSFKVKADAPKAPDTEDQDALIEPERIYSNNVVDIEIVSNPVGEQKIVFYLDESTMDIEVTILNAVNLKYTLGQSGSLSGLSSGVYLGRNEVANDNTIFPFDVEKTDETTLHGKFVSFGHCPINKKEHVLTLYVTLGDGQGYMFTWDVTDQMENAPDQKHIKIVLDGVPIPKPIVNGSGFHPDIDDWFNEEIEIHM